MMAGKGTAPPQGVLLPSDSVLHCKGGVLPTSTPVALATGWGHLLRVQTAPFLGGF